MDVPVTSGWVGYRVVVRHRSGDQATDVLGVLEGCGDTLRVRRADGRLAEIPAGDVLAARRVPRGPVRLRQARPEDGPAIEALRVGTWRTAYRGIVAPAYLDAMPVDGEVRRQRLAASGPGVTTFVAESAGRLVGWASGGPSRDDDVDPAGTGEVYACYVDPPWWGGGIGSRLLRRLTGELRTPVVTLWVLEANLRARGFYARHGFRPDGARAVLELGAPIVEVRYRRSG